MLSLEGRLAIVIDVLRWSTTALTALNNGAHSVEAYSSPEVALARAAGGDPRPLLGGERESRIIPGFDLGNSPLEYTPRRVRNRVVVTTTTNGTNALLAARAAQTVLVGAFVNLNAIVAAAESALRAGQAITLICAGQAGDPTVEDTACAGAIIEALVATRAVTPADRDPLAIEAHNAWIDYNRSAEQVLAASPHAATLANEGFADDLEYCALGSIVQSVGRAEGRVVQLS